MNKDKIFKPEDLPESNIILATKDTLKEIKEIKDKLHPYLNLFISINSTGRYQLHFIYKLLMRIQKGGKSEPIYVNIPTKEKLKEMSTSILTPSKQVAEQLIKLNINPSK